jgi:small subunit ribosomal protein S15e
MIKFFFIVKNKNKNIYRHNFNFTNQNPQKKMADEDEKVNENQTEEERIAALKKKRTFKKFQYRGVELEPLLDLTVDELVQMYPARARRRLSRGLKRKPKALITRLRKAKKEAVPGERPRGIKTHLRNMIIMPEMIGSVVGVYNGKVFLGFEVLPDMIGMYLGEFVVTYKPVTHGRPGIGSTTTSRFIPLK